MLVDSHGNLLANNLGVHVGHVRADIKGSTVGLVVVLENGSFDASLKEAAKVACGGTGIMPSGGQSTRLRPLPH